MNIGLFTDCYYPQVNGVVSSVLLLKEALTNRGHHVTIITVNSKGAKVTEDVIRIHSVPFSKWKEFRVGLPMFLSDFRKIKNLKLDLIHTHTEFSIGLMGKTMARILKIPLLHTYHTMYENYTHYFFGSKYGTHVAKKLIQQGSRIYIRNCNAVIAPSQKTKRALESYGVKNDIFIMPTGIKLEQFHNYEKNNSEILKLRESLNIALDTKVVLSLGRLSEEKSIDMIISQMQALSQKVPNVKLVIVGDGPYKPKLMQLCRTLDLETLVTFVGSVPWEDVSAYYSMADTFVSASKTETQGLTIIEAMASKIPVVIFKDENINGVIIHDFSGKLFLTKDELTDCLSNVLMDPIENQTMIENAFEMVQTLSKERFGETAETIYYGLLQTKTVLSS